MPSVSTKKYWFVLVKVTSPLVFADPLAMRMAVFVRGVALPFIAAPSLPNSLSPWLPHC
jgi:hypothetical protein